MSLHLLLGGAGVLMALMCALSSSTARPRWLRIMLIVCVFVNAASAGLQFALAFKVVK